MKITTRIIGLSVFFIALTPTAMARSIDDFVFPSRSSQSSAASQASSAANARDSSIGNVPSTLYATPGSSSSSSSQKSVDFRVRVKLQEPLTPAQRAEMEAQLPETRAGFVSMIVRRLYNNVTIDTCFWNIAAELPPEFTLVFTDVPVTHQYAKEICVAMNNGIIKGYGDGSFRPDGRVTFAEASKMISRAYALHPWPDVASVDSNPWFDLYVKTLDERAAIPASIRTFDQRMTRADVREILDRLDGKITSRSTTPLADLQQDWRRRFAAPVRRTAVSAPVIRRTAPAAAPSSSKASAAGNSASSVPTASSAAAQTSSARSYPAWIY